MLHTPIYPWGRPARPQRLNRFQKYNKPLPVHAQPLPAVDIQNPFSLLSLTYALVSNYFFTPSSHPTPLYQAYYDPATQSVQVTDETTVRALWEQGFFGKGSLSRSEPEWIERERKRLGLLGSSAGQTSADVTKKRRNERRELKMERARLEAEAVREQLRVEKEGVVGVTQLDNNLDHVQAAPAANGTLNDQDEANLDITVNSNSSIESSKRAMDAYGGIMEMEDINIIDNQEHLQLSATEAFFLAYSLGILTIINLATNQPLSVYDLFSLFRQVSYSPPRTIKNLQPDDPFILSYVVYHHFRSLGWVVRPGMKFAADFLLYHRGPVFAHAEFAVLIMPSYSHSYWSSDEGRKGETAQKASNDWWWLLGANRVQTQVRKSLILVYVDIPPPIPDVYDEDLNIAGALQQYRVREFVVKRWSANRNRD